jgi:hypothetical protein
VQRAEALFKLDNREEAQREAERAIAQAETFGFLSLARAHFPGEVLRQSSSAEAAPAAASARRDQGRRTARMF